MDDSENTPEMAAEAATSHPSLTIAEQYDRRKEEFAADAQRLSLHSNRMSRMRVALFLVFMFALVVAIQQGDVMGTHGAIAGAIFVFFVICVGFHDRILERLKDIQTQERLQAEQAARIRRQWDDVRRPRVEVPASAEAVAEDLDLFDKASLFHLACTAKTTVGREKLRDWIISPATPDTIHERQRAVALLAADNQTREQLALEGSRLADSHAGPHEICDWAISPVAVTGWRWLTILSRALPLAGVTSIGLAIGGVIPGVAAFFTCCFIVLANLIVSVLSTGTIHNIFNMVSSPNGEAQRYVTIFDMLERASHQTPAIQRLQRSVSEGRQAQAEIRRLGRIMSFANLRHDPLLALLYVIAQLVMLWDLHVFRFLERWRSQNGDHVARWFDALAEFEAISSLGTLAHDHPDWCFPSVSADHDQFAARNLGHPLIAADSCVRNDVELGPPGTFLLVTGSNMSGKSTLLRSIGANVHLAQAGAPVCAASLSMPPVEVATSMRVRDSLDDGVSFYMAELKRLKEVVDHSEHLREQGRSLLFLLDEILQGTNSAERHIAVSQVLKHLLAQQAFGAISTHDLELAASDTLMSSGKCVHFREMLVKDDRRMTFDYQMRPGVAPTTNALVLLEMVGLGERQ